MPRPAHFSPNTREKGHRPSIALLPHRGQNEVATTVVRRKGSRRPRYRPAADVVTTPGEPPERGEPPAYIERDNHFPPTPSSRMASIRSSRKSRWITLVRTSSGSFFRRAAAAVSLSAWVARSVISNVIAGDPATQERLATEIGRTERFMPRPSNARAIAWLTPPSVWREARLPPQTVAPDRAARRQFPRRRWRPYSAH